MTQPHKIAQDETQDRGNGLGGLALGTAGAAGAGGAYYGSHRLNRFLTDRGLAPGGDKGVLWKAFTGLLKARGLSPESVARYADASSTFLAGNVAPGTTGLESLRILGKAIFGAGWKARAVPFVGKSIVKRTSGIGGELSGWYKSDHFNGFPTGQAGVRTLVGEHASGLPMTVENTAERIRDVLEKSKWRVTDTAAADLDQRLRALYEAEWGHKTVPDVEHAKALLKAIRSKVRRGAYAGEIEQLLAHDLPSYSTISAAVRSAIRGKGGALGAVRRLSKTPAGMLANMLSAQHTNFWAPRHAVHIGYMGLLQALRSRKLRAGAGLAGGLSLAGGIYSALRNRKSN